MNQAPFHSSFLRSAAALTLLALTAIGCNNSKTAPTPENFTKTLNAYFVDHPDCLLPNARFPLETTDKAETTRLDALVKNKLLDMSYETSVRTSRYTITPAGTRYAPHFCIGHRNITSIDSSTPLTVVNGFKQTTITYHYTLLDVPVWAKSADVLAAFPQINKATSGETAATANLVQSIAGWQVPD